MLRDTRRKLLAGALTATVIATTPAVAHAQLSSDEQLQEMIAGSSQSPEVTGSSLNALLSSSNLLSSGEVPLFGPMIEEADGYPLPTDASITEVEFLNKEVIDEERRIEEWQVASPSKKRVVDVQVIRAADPEADSPMLYLLDGVGGNRNNSGWIRQGAPEVFAEENVTVIMPLGAAASMYSDWQEEDPALGRIQWETFIVEELAPALEAEPELNFNGRRGVGGLSMGAIGAVHLANSNPEVFDAAIGISGCYSTMDPIGRPMIQLIVESRGGDVENMWGPYGSETWHEHDVVADPTGLAGMAVYLSTANGAVGPADAEHYADGPFYNMAAGVILERGALSCTQELESALEAAGATDVTVDYLDTGLHNWINYSAQLQPGWDAVKHALY